jgi:hypothetical protein
MNRRDFIKLIGALAGSLCLPFEVPASETIPAPHKRLSDKPYLVINSDSNKISLELLSITAQYPRPEMFEFTSHEDSEIYLGTLSIPYTEGIESLDCQVYLGPENVENINRAFAADKNLRCEIFMQELSIEFEAFLNELVMYLDDKPKRRIEASVVLKQIAGVTIA